MKIVFDPKLRRPGCALLQVMFGGDVPSLVFGFKFPHETWLLAPTPDMGPYEVSEQQLDLLVEIAYEAVGLSAQRDADVPNDEAVQGSDDEPRRPTEQQGGHADK